MKTLSLAAIALGFVLEMACCRPVTTKQAQTAAEAAYGLELAQCVDRATTLAESRACRAEVDKRWGVNQIK